MSPSLLTSLIWRKPHITHAKYRYKLQAKTSGKREEARLADERVEEVVGITARSTSQ
jgi:hypothetical protein